MKIQEIKTASNKSKNFGLYLSNDQAKKVNEAVIFTGNRGKNFEWDKVFIGQLGLTSAQNDTLRVDVRKSLKESHIDSNDWLNLIDKPESEFLKYFNEHKEKFANLHNDNIFIGLISKENKAFGSVIVNLNKLVEISKGQKVISK